MLSTLARHGIGGITFSTAFVSTVVDQSMISNAFLVSLVALWAHCVSGLSIDENDFKYTLNTTGTNTYAGAINYGRTHPTRDGGSWSGW